MLSRPGPFSLVLIALAALGCGASGSRAQDTGPKPKAPPNVVWIMGDDMGPDLACYGNRAVKTPNLDRLAEQGTRFTRCFTTAPVCSPSRSALITGMYQTTIGAHHHRSHREDGYRLPDGVRLMTDRLREQGYFTVNARTPAPGLRTGGKTDFNFTVEKPYDGADWSERKAGQPFFAQINFTEPHRGPAWPAARKQPGLVDPAKVELPPYYPDHPLTRDDYANYLDAIQLLDTKVGAVLKRLDDEGLSENTLVFFFGDNGRCHVRDKQWLYEGGTHIPLIVRWPGRVKPGSVREDLVSSIDITAASLEAAGVKLPREMQGRPFLAPGDTGRPYIFTARDRCDETVDRIRAVRDRRWKYIRNFHPERPYTQPNAYKERQYPVLPLMKQLHAEGKLTPVQQLFMAPRRPAEELYDLESDPHEVRNLAADPKHAAELKRLREVLDRWIRETGDQGAMAEKPAPAGS